MDLICEPETDIPREVEQLLYSQLVPLQFPIRFQMTGRMENIRLLVSAQIFEYFD